MGDWLRRHCVLLAALAVVVLRLPGLLFPAGADEAGFTLVARAWSPEPGSLYGAYFVDRPPLVIAVFGLADLLGTPWGIRLLGALCAGATVLLVGRVARLVGTGAGERPAALLAAAMLAAPLIDPVTVKGELLALPLILAACWWTLLATRRLPSHPLLLVGAAGAAGALAVGLKQSLIGGLVFALTLVLLSAGEGAREGVGVRRRGLVATLAVGAAVPVLLTVAWAVLTGVSLETLSYAVLGFRADASAVLAAGDQAAAMRRLWQLLGAAVAVGMGWVLVAYLASLRASWRTDAPVTGAVGAMLVVDGLGVLGGGSFWLDYLFALVPSMAIALAVTAGRRARRVRGWVAGVTVATTLVTYAGWAVLYVPGRHQAAAPATGRAIAAAAEPGDTLTVFGGRADVQFASGLESPYPHLWSLPMRTLDPDLYGLQGLVVGPEAPTWIVEWWPFDLWQPEGGARLRQLVEDRYVRHGTGCDGKPIWLRRGSTRPPVSPDC